MWVIAPPTRGPYTLHPVDLQLHGKNCISFPRGRLAPAAFPSYSLAPNFRARSSAGVCTALWFIPTEDLAQNFWSWNRSFPRQDQITQSMSIKLTRSQGTFLTPSIISTDFTPNSKRAKTIHLPPTAYPVPPTTDRKQSPLRKSIVLGLRNHVKVLAVN